MNPSNVDRRNPKYTGRLRHYQARLVARGFAIIRAGRPLRYTAVAPAEAIERLLEERRRELADAERVASDAAGRLTATYEAGRDHTDPLDFIEVLREPGAIAARFAELQAAAQNEILVFTKPPYATPPAENVEGLKLLERATARSVYERSILDHPDALEAVEEFIRAGEQARLVGQLPLKLAIIDRRIAIFRRHSWLGWVFFAAIFAGLALLPLALR